MQGKVSVSIKNSGELKKLLALANRQAKQLEDTLNKITEFELSVVVDKS